MIMCYNAWGGVMHKLKASASLLHQERYYIIQVHGATTLYHAVSRS